MRIAVIGLMLGMSLWVIVVNVPILAALDQRGVTRQAEIVWTGDPFWRWHGHQASSSGVREDIRYGFTTTSGVWIERTDNRKERHAKDLTVGRRCDVTSLPDRPDVFQSDLFQGYASLGMDKALLILAGRTDFCVVSEPRHATGLGRTAVVPDRQLWAQRMAGKDLTSARVGGQRRRLVSARRRSDCAPHKTQVATT